MIAPRDILTVAGAVYLLLVGVVSVGLLVLGLVGLVQRAARFLRGLL